MTFTPSHFRTRGISCDVASSAPPVSITTDVGHFLTQGGWAISLAPL